MSIVTDEMAEKAAQAQMVNYFGDGKMRISASMHAALIAVLPDILEAAAQACEKESDPWAAPSILRSLK